MPEAQYYYPPTEERQIHARHREELASDLGMLAVNSLSVGIIDMRSSSTPEVSPPPVESRAEVKDTKEMEVLFRQVMGEVTMKRLYLDERTAFEGRSVN